MEQEKSDLFDFSCDTSSKLRKFRGVNLFK